ncbi:MAG: ATP-binding cassette domain-containing protein, partial [Sedimentibacter sp.]|uniref:ABC transporter ATP-binding protein n=1 Tax=Sedimentibacter sp. TaxID=1960295 RepID=UPI0029817A3E
MSSIQFHNINKSFGDVKVLENIKFEIEEKKIICLVGPSGCGKSTILNLLSGRYTADSGEILNVAEKNISYIFQKPRLIPWLTLEKNMDFVLGDKSNRKEIINEWLTRVELDGYEKSYPSQLSGGMEQRAALARAFMVPSDLLLMDEPFKGLDEPLKLRMLELVYKLWENNPKNIVFVTHDIREALLLG